MRRQTREVEQQLNLGFHGNWDFLISGFVGDEDECAELREDGLGRFSVEMKMVRARF